MTGTPKDNASIIFLPQGSLYSEGEIKISEFKFLFEVYLNAHNIPTNY